MPVTESIPNNKERRLIPITKWNTYHAWPPVGGLRYLAFNAQNNGFNHCLVKVGRRVLIDETRFFEWIDCQKKGGQK
jgi:hypothetical protein